MILGIRFSSKNDKMSTVWADSENGVNGSDFSKEKILRKRSSAHAQLIKISHFYVKTGHSGKLIVQSGLFICRSENTFKCFIRHVSTECIWQKYTFVGQIKFYLLSKFVNSVSDDEANKVNKLMFFSHDFTIIKDNLCARV